MKKIEDLKNKTFGRLKVLGFSHQLKNGSACWICKCGCGKEVICSATHLKSGHSTSCGCWRKDINKALHTVHGLRYTKLHAVWATMKSRCQSKNSKDFKDYGGRGIRVCESWKSFVPFHVWAMANGYRDDLTIDRMNVNGNYEPSNCRWATWKQQANNRREKTAV